MPHWAAACWVARLEQRLLPLVVLLLRRGVVLRLPLRHGMLLLVLLHQILHLPGLAPAGGGQVGQIPVAGLVLPGRWLGAQATAAAPAGQVGGRGDHELRGSRGACQSKVTVCRRKHSSGSA